MSEEGNALHSVRQTSTKTERRRAQVSASRDVSVQLLVFAGIKFYCRDTKTVLETCLSFFTQRRSDW